MQPCYPRSGSEYQHHQQPRSCHRSQDATKIDPGVSLDKILIPEQEEGREVPDDPGEFEDCPKYPGVSGHCVLVRIVRQKCSLIR